MPQTARAERALRAFEHIASIAERYLEEDRQEADSYKEQGGPAEFIRSLKPEDAGVVQALGVAMLTVLRLAKMYETMTTAQIAQLTQEAPDPV